ncbi:hypothetical protein ONZ45_g9324 [Pleurotus djamor]|nr:hypothetical protein ONZ45_g9324 [Pleurotus djamor]
MASQINKFLVSLTPPPFHTPEEYDGLEYRWRFLTFRPAYFTNEVYLIGGILFYVIYFLYGKSQNARRANKWYDAHMPLLSSQFSKPTVNGLVSDGYSDCFNFSTGRRNIASLHSIFKFRPRHDLLQMLYQTIYGLVEVHTTYTDDLELDFTLSDGAVHDGFVWAVVKKEELRTAKDGRWDLTFTKTSDNAALPSQFSVMSEFADVTDSVIKSTGLVQMLQDPAILPYFRSLSITDQPRDRPTAPEGSEKHVILTLHCPPPSASPYPTLKFTESLFNFIDSLHKLSLRPETKSKLKKYRDDVTKEIKLDSEREKREELEQQAEDKKAEKKRKEDERISKLSAAEQQKILDKERKRALRKTQGKVGILWLNFLAYVMLGRGGASLPRRCSSKYIIAIMLHPIHILLANVQLELRG